ncbi:hypothetical protein ACFQZ4_51845 [Catellatospora coxensis]
MGAWIKDHLSLVIAIAVGVTVLTKIWSVAHGNEYTMAALFTSQGGLNVTIAALVAGLPSLGYLPMVLTYPALIAAAWAGHSLRGPVIAAVIASILAFATIPTGYLLIYLVVAVASIGSSFLIVWIRRRLLAKGRDPENCRSSCASRSRRTIRRSPSGSPCSGCSAGSGSPPATRRGSRWSASPSPHRVRSSDTSSTRTAHGSPSCSKTTGGW